MNLKSFAALLTLPAGFAVAQKAPTPPDPMDRRAEQTIIIRKKDTAGHYTINIDGDKVTVNGKPIEDSKDVDVRVMRTRTPRAMVNGQSWAAPEAVTLFNSNKAVLGVSTEKTDAGLSVTDVGTGSGAEKAGLKKGDIIVSAGGSAVSTSEDLYKVVGKLEPDSKLDIVYKRDGKQSSTSAVLQKSSANMSFRSFNGNDFNENFNRNFNFTMPRMEGLEGLGGRIAPRVMLSGRPRLGMQIQDTENGKGVKVLDVDSELPAGKAGLKKDDVITSVNGKNVNTVEEAQAALRDLKEGGGVDLGYLRDGKSAIAPIKLPKRLRTSNL